MRVLVIPVFWFTPVHVGGFGFSPLYISIFLAIAAVAQAIWLLFIFPPLQHKIGTGGILRWCSYGYPFFYSIYPICNLFLRYDMKIAFWAVVLPMSVLGAGVGMGLSTSFLN